MAAGTGNMETRRRSAAESAYTALICLSVFGSAAAMLFWSSGAVTPGWLTVIRCAAAALGLALNRRKGIGFYLLTAYLALLFLRLLVPAPERLFTPKVSDTLLHGAWVFLGCWSLPFALGAKKAASVLRVIVTGWCLCMAAMAAVALYAAWGNREIWNLSGGAFWGLDVKGGNSEARLKMFFDVNTSGVIFGQAVLVCIYVLATAEHRGMKFVYAAALIPVWTALCLTDCRTATITTATGAGMAAGILVRDRIRERKSGNRIPAWTRVVCAAVVTATACVFLQSGTTMLFNMAKTTRRNFLSGAAAEADKAFTVSIWPAEQKVGYGETAVIEAETEGADGKIVYRWQASADGEEWTDLKGSTAGKKRLKILVSGAGVYTRNRYRCVVTAGGRTEVSGEALILKPFQLTIAQSIRKRPGGNEVRLTARTVGAEGKVSCRWRIRKEGEKDWTDMAGDEDAPNRLTVELSGETAYQCIAEAGNGSMVGGGTVKYSSEARAAVRGFSSSNLLNGRDLIWFQAGRFLLANPRTLLIGRSIHEPMKDTGIMRGQNETEHCHNGLLQTTLESGIPGLAIMVVFLAWVCGCAIRLIRSDRAGTAMSLLPAAVLPLWLGEMAECIARMSNTRAPVFFMLMLLTSYVCAAGSLKQTREAEARERKEEPGDPDSRGRAGRAGTGDCGAAGAEGRSAAEGDEGAAGGGQQEF